MSDRFTVEKAPGFPGEMGWDVVDNETKLKLGVWTKDSAESYARDFNDGTLTVESGLFNWSVNGNEADIGRTDGWPEQSKLVKATEQPGYTVRK